MAFVFKSAKNLEMIPKKLKVNNLYKEQEEYSGKNKDKSAPVPFLSKSEKLFEKIEDTPGPGQYNIQKAPNNFIHKQYIKKNIEQYKDSFNGFVNLMNNFGFKFEVNITPGPGDYNPGENKNFGAKIKRQNTFRNNFLLNQNEYMLKNLTFINYLDNEKNLSMMNSKNTSNISNNKNNNSSINLSKTKKFDSSHNKIFKKLLFSYSKLNQEDSSSIKDKETFYSKEEGLNSFNVTNNFNDNSNSQLNLHILKKSNSTTYFLRNMKAKIFKAIDDHIRIKEISDQKKLEMKAFSAKSNYYLEKYLNSKIFSQLPGPGYYFSKPPPDSLIITNDKIDKIKKKINKKLINKITNQNNNIKEKNKIEIISEKQRTKKIPLSKTMYQLKNDIIKKDFEKVKDVFIRNKYNSIIDKLIKTQQLEEKTKSNKNNNKEIQEEGYPIRYIKKFLPNKKYNNSINFNSKEKRFIGHTGWENDIIKNVNPGPGEYESDAQSISKKNKNLISLNLLKGYQVPKDRKLFTDEIKDTIPPVGTYQSQIYNSIEFNNQKSLKITESPIKYGFQEIFKEKNKKRIEEKKLNEKIANSMLSPCSYFNYYNSINQNLENKNYKGSKINKIYNNTKEMKKISEGDYGYPINRFEPNNWIKKTFNASFV